MRRKLRLNQNIHIDAILKGISGIILHEGLLLNVGKTFLALRCRKDRKVSGRPSLFDSNSAAAINPDHSSRYYLRHPSAYHTATAEPMRVQRSLSIATALKRRALRRSGRFRQLLKIPRCMAQQGEANILAGTQGRTSPTCASDSLRSEMQLKSRDCC